MAYKDEINVESLISALIRLVLEFAILYFIYFWLLGDYTNMQNRGVFFSVLFVLFIVVIPIQVQFEMLGKHGFRWSHCFDKYTNKMLASECNELQAQHEAQAVKLDVYKGNVWRMAIFYSIAFSCIGGAIIGLYHLLLGGIIWLEIVVVAIAAILIFIPLIYMLNNRCLFPLCYRLSSGQSLASVKYSSVDDYYFFNHIMPWSLVTLVTSLLIAHKMSAEWIFSNGALDLLNVSMFAGSSGYMTLLWMCYESKQQAAVEKRLGVYMDNPDNKLNSGDFIFLLNAVPLGVVAVGYGLGYLIFDGGISQTFAIIYTGLSALICGAFGNVLGLISSSTDIDTDQGFTQFTDSI